MPVRHDPPGAAPTAAPTLADRIDRCFQTMHPDGRGPWTYREVADGVNALGVTVSPSYLWQLRRGKKDNPTIGQIEGLARFFHIPATYFLGTDTEVDNIDAQMQVVRAMRSPQIRDLTLRASSLTPAGLRVIADLVESLQSVQGMANRPDASGTPPEPELEPEPERGSKSGPDDQQPAARPRPPTTDRDSARRTAARVRPPRGRPTP